MFGLFDILARHGIDVKANYSDSNEYRINCLFCTDMGVEPDYKYRLGFNISSGLGHCYHCDWKSRKAIVEILKKLEEDYSGIPAGTFTQETRKRPEPVELPEGFELLQDTDFNDPMFGRAVKYIKERGVTEEQLIRHGIGATTIDKTHANSIIFPVPLVDGKLAGFVSRDYTGHRELRYMNSRGTKVSFNIFGPYPDRVVIISEGILKALAIERAIGNKYCSAATLGKGMSNVQLEGIRRFQEVVLFPDPDKDGLEGFIGVAADLHSVIKRVTVAWPIPEKQADELTSAEIREHLKSRKPYTPLVQSRMMMEARNRKKKK